MGKRICNSLLPNVVWNPVHARPPALELELASLLPSPNVPGNWDPNIWVVLAEHSLCWAAVVDVLVIPPYPFRLEKKVIEITLFCSSRASRSFRMKYGRDLGGVGGEFFCVDGGGDGGGVDGLELSLTNLVKPTQLMLCDNECDQGDYAREA